MITGINHVTLVVSDVARAIDFYQGRLGLHLRAHGPRGAYLEAGNLWLALEKGQPDQRTDDSHIALSCSAANFQILCRALSDMPVWKTNRSEGASLYFLDPDGHKLELHLGDLESRLAQYRADPPRGITVL